MSSVTLNGALASIVPRRCREEYGSDDCGKTEIFAGFGGKEKVVVNIPGCENVHRLAEIVSGASRSLAERL